MIGDQPHMLAYINPQEEQALRDMGGTGLPGPDGIPAYWSFTDPSSWGDGQGYTGGSDTGQAVVDTFTSVKDNVTDFFTPTTTPTITPTVTNTNTNTNTNTTPVVTTTTDTGTGSNTILQDLTNLVTFAGNKSYVDGKEITVNNLGQNFANWVTDSDNLEYKDNVLYDLTTGVPVVGAEAEASFFNTGYDENTGTYENKLAPTNITGSTMVTPEVSVSTKTPEELAEIAKKIEEDRLLAEANNIPSRYSREGRTYFDDNNNPYDSVQEAINANTALLSSNTVSAGTDVGTDVGTVNTVGALPSGSNTVTQFFANLLTPFDNQSYVDGNLVYNDAGDFTEDPTAATNQSGFVDPTAGAGSALLTSAYAKIAAGNNADLTEPEQRALYGQRGTVPNAAETLALTENYKASGAVTMTQDMQDEIINDMLSGGATKSQIDEYKERSPVGSDVNPFFDTYDELSGFDKFGRAITNVLNFAINKATYGLIDPAAMKEAQADEFVDAYESEGSTGGQFDWNDPDALDLSPGEEGDANFELLLELSKGEGIEPTLQGVVGEDGETVEGAVSVKNTKDGAVIVEDDAGGATSGIGDGDDKPSSEIVMSLYNRYRKGGSGAGMPPWLRKYASGVSINQLLTKVTINGQEYYKTPTGDYILPEELVGAIKGDVETPETET
tara:strand:+ start:977 stop:2983 length:2007 start_codon:yes stop_codon:yes gene_type:complete